MADHTYKVTLVRAAFGWLLVRLVQRLPPDASVEALRDRLRLFDPAAEAEAFISWMDHPEREGQDDG